MVAWDTLSDLLAIPKAIPVSLGLPANIESICFFPPVLSHSFLSPSLSVNRKGLSLINNSILHAEWLLFDEKFSYANRTNLSAMNVLDGGNS